MYSLYTKACATNSAPLSGGRIVFESAQDYYPFGMLMPSRTSNSDNYRFGFNGKENDNEVKGIGDQQDYGMRIYDPRLGRFLSVDPLTLKYPWFSPYQFAGNDPIWATDLDGKEAKIEIGKNSFEIDAFYVAEQKVLDNIDVIELQSNMNEVFNSNPTNYPEFTSELPQIMPNDRAVPRVNPKLKITFNIKIYDTPATPEELNNSKHTRIRAANGASKGGLIVMGKSGEAAFKPTLNKVTNRLEEVPAQWERGGPMGDIIKLNPDFYDTHSKMYHGFKGYNVTKYGVFAHEIGHDFGLTHPDGIYPEHGTMAQNGETPTEQEIKEINNPSNYKIIQPGELRDE